MGSGVPADGERSNAGGDDSGTLLHGALLDLSQHGLDEEFHPVGRNTEVAQLGGGEPVESPEGRAAPVAPPERRDEAG